MLPLALSLMLGVATSEDFADPPVEPSGIIQGVVVDGTNDGKPLEGADVILRAGTDGEMVSVAETKTDRYGKFLIEHVPPDPAIVYMPGANRDGVHYPGRRVRLDANNQAAYVRIVAFAAVTSPNPLVAKRHDIDLGLDGQALTVTERLSLSNPTRTTYVGQSMGNGPPVTFWLSIPKSFDRVTFEREFFGRRFIVVDHRPVTDVPWLPGEHELRFTYHVPLAESGGRFVRPLDVPNSHVRVCVHDTSAGRVSCNLPRAEAADGEVIFASAGGPLPESFALELTIKAVPFPWMQYARWGALIALVALAAATALLHRLRGSRIDSPAKTPRQTRKKQRAA